MLSGRITSARVVGTLFSIDPAMSVIIAAPILRQTITAVAVLGVIVVSLAGTLLVWASGGDDARKSRSISSWERNIESCKSDDGAVQFSSSRRPVFVFTRNEPHNRTINIVISSGEGDVAWARLWGFAAYRS